MKRFIRSKKAMAAVGLATGLTLASGIGAYAYFTTTGSGSGTAAVGTSSNLTIHGTSATTLYPGTSSTVSFTADNPSPGHQQLGTIYLASVKACSTGTWAPSVGASGACSTDNVNANGVEATGCESVDPGNANDATTNYFYMADVAANQDLPHGNGTTVTAQGTLTLHNFNVSQDSCKGASLFLNLATR